jgi:CBS domain containing-hemolysin-like protein
VIEVVFVLLAVVLILACAVFVAAEFSLTTVEPSELERSAEAGERGASSALKAVRRLTFELSGAQLGITITSLVVGMLAEPSLARLLKGPLEAIGFSDRSASTAALVVGVTLSTAAVMVFGELVPKNWAISHPLGVARMVAGPQRAFSRLFGPLIRHLNGTANRVVRRLGLEPIETLASARAPDELVALARRSAAEGLLEPDSADMFGRILHLGELTAEHVMTPRVDVTAVPASATGRDVVARALATGLSRFPVHGDGLDDLDDLIGVVHVADVVALDEADRERVRAAELATEPLLVPYSLSVDRLLDQLRAARSMALVIDEYGGVAGVVTQEDIVEEVVGEVFDEHDPVEEPDLVAVADGEWDVDGSVRLDELAMIGLDVPEGAYDTVAGLVAAALGRVPDVGDTVEVEGWRLVVREVDHHHATRVRLDPVDGSGSRPGFGPGPGPGPGPGSRDHDDEGDRR